MKKILINGKQFWKVDCFTADIVKNQYEYKGYREKIIDIPLNSP